MLPYVQITSILILLCLHANAEAPPGYTKSPEVADTNPPKYEYGYNIEDQKGTGQGKLETRDGIYALGRYYVQGSDATQSVQYYADDWGYHPLVEYSSVGPHSKSNTHLLLGVEAVKALATNKFTPKHIPPNQHITETIDKINQNQQQTPAIGAPSQQQLVVQPPQQQQFVVEQPSAQPVGSQQPQQILVEQPQTQPQQIVVEQPQAQPLVLEQSQPQHILLEQPQPQQQQIVLQQQQQPQQLVYLQQSQPEQNLIVQQSQQEIDGESLAQQISGSYGSKINVIEKSKPSSYVVQNSVVQHTPNKLIQSTKNLVSGEDVLNINSALDASTSIETSTAKAVVTQYESSNIQSADTVSNVQVNNEGITGYSSTTPVPLTTVTQTSLIKQPIVVADVEEQASFTTVSDIKQQTKAEVFSTTGNTIETVSTTGFDTTEPSTILVTPRPVSTNFLAPITAGIQLQNVENSDEAEISAKNQQYLVDIQKSLPYYLGKFEYMQGVEGYGEKTAAQSIIKSASVQEKAVENFELGKTLLSFPEPQALVQPKIQIQESNKLVIQQLPEQDIKENFIEIDQQQAQVQQVQQIQHVQQVNVPVVVEKFVEKKVPVPVVQTQIVEKPVEVTKIVKQPYPVQVPVHVPIQVPVPVERHVPVPVTVERFVDRPFPVTQIVEKPIHIPQPYPVEKIVDRPVHIPIEVTRYVDRPYPVEVPVAHPVPYPIDRIVEKVVKQPYPVEVRVPVEVKVPVAVEKIVERKVPVPHYIPKPYPVDRIVEKPVPQYIDRPYAVPVKVPVPVAQPYVVPVQVAKPYILGYAKYVGNSYSLPVVTQGQKYTSVNQNIQLLYKQQHQQLQQQQQQLQQEQQNAYYYANPYSYAPAIKAYLPPSQAPKLNNGYLPPTHNCDQQNSHSSQNPYYTIRPDDYIGLLPPKLANSLKNQPRKFRNARSHFNSNLRLEYGFMPPLIPSQEVDEQGNPIEKNEHK